jgi:sn-glycerol 3-phosphate transport system substrate-binding protein
MKRRALLAAAGSVAATACAGGEEGVPLWFSYGGKNREALLALVAAFNAEHPEHRIAPVYQGDYFELLAKLRTALHAGRAPAVTHVVAEVLPYLVDAGVLERLDVLPGLGGDLDLVGPLSQAGCFAGPMPEGMYGVPFNRSTPIAYLDGRVLEELKLPPPTTWDELRTFAAAATRGDEATKRWGFSVPVDWWFWVAMTGQAGGTLTDAEGRFSLGGDAGVRALSFIQELVYERKVMRPPPGRDYNAWQVQNAEFLAGRIAMIWTSTAFVRYLEDNAKFPVVCARLPRDERAAVPTGGTMFVMPKGSSSAWTEAAARFVAFMARPDKANEFATKTGYIPVTRAGIAALERDGYYQKKPNDRVAVDQLDDVVPWPWHKELFRVQREVVQARLEAAVLAREDARGALDAARRVIAEAP